jgi:hypothetical protein
MRRQAAWVAPLVLLNACATVLHGEFGDVRVESEPPGATATVSASLSERGPAFLDPAKQYTVTTPATLRLRRDNTYRVEYSKPGYRIATTQIQSAYDWLWSPLVCGPCEAVGQLPKADMKDRALPLRFLEGTFYGYPRGFVRALGLGLRAVSPEAWFGMSFRHTREGGHVFSNWTAMGVPVASATLQRAD